MLVTVNVTTGKVVNNPAWVAPSYEPPLTEADFSAAIDAHVDLVAQARGYRDAVSVTSYATSTKPAYAADAAAFVAWRDELWDTVFAIYAAVTAGQRPPPATTAALIAEISEIVWPEAP